MRTLRKVRPLPLLAILVAAAPVPAACTKKQPQPIAPTTTPDAGAADGLFAFAMGDAAAEAGPAMKVASGSPDAGPVASGSAIPIPSGSVLPREAVDAAMDAPVAAMAAKVAPKMTLEGQPGRASLTEGGKFNMLVTLQPNRCYTIIGFSPAGGVQSLDLKLMAPPFYTLQAGASGANDTANPVIGKGKEALCPIIPLPVPYRLDATALKGAGRIGIHVYSRAK